MNKYEQLIEHIINDNEQAARELFHDIVVERSRDIYESIMDEEAMEEEIGGNQVSGLVDEITQDETDGLGEDEEDMGGDEPLAGDEMDHDFGDEVGDDEMGAAEGEGNLEDKFRSIEDALEDLKAEFAELTGDEAGDDMGGMDDMGGDDMGGEEPAFGGDEESHETPEVGDEHGMMEGEQPEWLKKGSGKSGSGKSGKSGSAMAGSGKSGSGKSGSAMSESELMREYVEKLGSYDKVPAGSEGEEVAKGGAVSVNKQSVTAGKNDMGGTAANIAKGGSEAAPDGNAPKGKAGGFVKPAQEIDVAKRNVNKPGGNKGAQDWYNTKAKAKAGEGQTTDGSVPVNKSSIEGGR